MKDIPREEPCPDCGRFANRGITIDAVIIRDDKLLLNKRSAEPDKGTWALSGGYVEWDESAPDAVMREVAEETGLKVTNVRLFGV